MPNKMERFSHGARRILSLAQQEAETMQHTQIGTEHLLIGLLRHETGIAARVLHDLDVDLKRVQDLALRLSSFSTRDPNAPLELSHGTKQVLELSVDEARKLGHQEIGTEHLLLGIVRQTEGTAIHILNRLDISPEVVRNQIVNAMKTGATPRAEAPAEGISFPPHGKQMERFTQRARRVLSLAQEEAERLQHSYIGTEHLLLGLMREETGVAGRVLRDLGLEQRRVEELVERMTRAYKRTSDTQFDLSPGTKKVLELAVDEARRMGHHYIGTEHLLLGLVRQTEGVAIDVLKRLGISPEEIRRQTRRVLQESPVQSASQGTGISKAQQPALDIPLHFTITLNEKAPIEFTLTSKQFYEVYMHTLLALQKGTLGTLYEETKAGIRIMITRADTGEADKTPTTDEQ